MLGRGKGKEAEKQGEKAEKQAVKEMKQAAKKVKEEQVREGKEEAIKEGKTEAVKEGKALGEAVATGSGEGVILYPLISEKAVNMIERENKICFIVGNKASKADVRRVVEKEYKVRVDAVRIINDRKGRKKAMVKINKEFKADEIATRLGVV